MAATTPLRGNSDSVSRLARASMRCPVSPAMSAPVASDEIENNWTTSVPTFDEMQLKVPLLRGIFAYGFEKPSPVQQAAIPALLTGRDTIAQAQSGTGKTATFTIGVLQRLDEKRAACQALLMAPTRELAQQTFVVVAALSDFMGIKTALVMGKYFTLFRKRTKKKF